MRSMPYICVFCGSSEGRRPAYLAAARRVGSALAQRGVGLVYGGGKVGLMGALADAALAGGGTVIGVIPEFLEAREIAHRGLTELRVVRSMHDRKAVMADLSDEGGVGPTVGRIVLGYYSVLAVLTVPLVWGWKVVAGGRVRWPALLVGALFTAACLSGFLQGFVIFLALPLRLGAPFGGFTGVGAVVAVGLWLFLLHLVLLVCWLLTQSLDERLARSTPEP